MDTTEILIQIRKIVRSVDIESKKIQKEYGVSIPQVLCLSYLNTRSDYQATHKSICDFLTLNSSTVTGIIDRLEKKGLVARLPKKDDKRNTYITITSKGSSLLESIPPLMHERLSSKLEKLSEKEISNIINSLDIIVDFLDVGGIDAAPVLTIEDDINKTEND